MFLEEMLKIAEQAIDALSRRGREGGGRGVNSRVPDPDHVISNNSWIE